MHPDDEPPDNLSIESLDPRGQHHSSAPRSRRSQWLRAIALLLAATTLVAAIVASAARPAAPHITHAQATTRPLPPPASANQDQAVFAALAARPLQLPLVTALASCPVTQSAEIGPGFALAAGSNPVYMLGATSNGTVPYTPATEWGDALGWGGIPLTLWVFRGSFGGPVLVRGERLDASGSVQFNIYEGPLQSAARMVVYAQPGAAFQAAGGAWYIRFNGPGCYGLQLDWPNGTERIVFRAE